MRKGDLALASEVTQKLIDFSFHIPLPGISDSKNLDCLVEQIIDSTRRIRYVTTIRDFTFSPIVTDPSEPTFNPLKASIWHKANGNIDEAFWLIFLFVHFGKHFINNWSLIRNVYGGLESGQVWNWETTRSDPEAFRLWLSQNQLKLQQTGRFGNHRKYENLKADHPWGTAAILRSYINWIDQFQTHSQMMQVAKNIAGDDPKILFNYLYRSMNNVLRFGRTAKFDYLTMVGKMELERIEPGSAYLSEATGPRRGARLLFGGNTNASITANELETNLGELNEFLNLYFGWQVLEDSLCNWQKSPGQYIHFKG
ncbi:alpha-glutamyl/putrescinyl thymine pyrophosphorylase clade 3 protein [Larkinella rosea]|uniref:Alpha-glutamyl/putrescinyl thymine pyrophosphorylase clade 3 domain-containing protein n=1 Tax=Larkinella rosea TaxID=2025312 RepID=A0A3P1BDT3_9BACT|nr:hypothetical protein [Larkinella rosea]RRA99214.1 hypothetical protein EHT25_30080 [Larkinella rosea]